MKINNIILFIVWCICILWGSVLGEWMIIGWGWSIFAAYSFYIELGRTIPYISATQLISSLQWIIAPTIIYSMNGIFYEMVVPKNYYFSVVVPAYLSFLLGLNINYSQKYILIHEDKDIKDKETIIERNEINNIVIMNLLLLALLGSVIFVVPQLREIAYLLKMCFGIAVIFCIMKSSIKDALFANLLFFLYMLIFTSFSKGYFHNALLWCFWFSAFWLVRLKPSRKIIILFIIVSIFVVSTLQLIKNRYRNSYNYSFSNFMIISIESWNDNNTIMENARFWERMNEGWHISQVIKYMDETNRFQHGYSIIDSIISIFIPRIILQNKRKAGGRENFNTMTYYKLNERTSMNVSYVGEGYGNFGRIGCCVFTFIVGLLLNIIFFQIFLLHQKYDYFLYFMPMILFNAIRAENDFFTAFGQIWHGFVIAIIIIYNIKNQIINKQKSVIEILKNKI